MKKLYLAVFASNLALLSYGLFFGWSSPSLSILLSDDSPIHLTMEQATLVSSIFMLGGVVGALMCKYFINLIGRKWTMLFTAAPGIIGWMMIAFASSAWELIVGRFICGISNGYGYMSTYIYAGEISPAKIRGIITFTLILAAKVGMFLEYLIGPFLSVRDLALVSSAFFVVFFLTMVSLPESPYHLMRRGRHDEAITSLMQLRGTTDVSEEAQTIEKYIKLDLANSSGLLELFRVPGNRKALMVVLGLVLVLQCTGFLTILSYAELIFNATNDSFEAKYVAMVMGGTLVVCGTISTSFGDYFNRRTLLIVSMSGVCVSDFIVGLFFFLQRIQMDVDAITWLPAVGLILFSITFSIGLAGLPFTMMSELFPTNVKAWGNTLALVCNNFSAFVINIAYQSIAQQYGIFASFWLFAVVALVGVIFVYFYVPETKGKTLQEIQEHLHGYKL